MQLVLGNNLTNTVDALFHNFAINNLYGAINKHVDIWTEWPTFADDFFKSILLSEYFYLF